MPVLAIFYGAGIHKAEYELLRKEIGWEKQHPAGGMFHAASFDAKGDAHVVDVWESQQGLDAFVGTYLMPLMQRHNIPAPKVEVFPVHNLNVYRSIEQFLLKQGAQGHP